MLIRKYVLQVVSGGKYPKICATADKSLVERKGKRGKETLVICKVTSHLTQK